MKKIKLTAFVVVASLLLSIFAACSEIPENITESDTEACSETESDTEACSETESDTEACSETETETEAESQPIFSEGLTFSSNGDKTCSVSKIGSCTDKDVIIPSVSPDGDTVTSIGTRAFKGCSSLNSITIPESVTSIEANAFENCVNLKSVIFPENSQLASIGEFAFYKCEALSAVYVYDITFWCNIAFSHCDSNPLYYAHRLYLNDAPITRLTIPESVTSIGAYAFAGGSSFTDITISEGVESIGKQAFFGCILLRSISIPDSVTSIGEWAFYNCHSLTSLTIPAGVTSIDYQAFLQCYNLKNITVSKENTKYHSYENCLIETATGTLVLGSANSIIPDDGSVTSIGDSAFFFCRGISDVTIPESVTSIGKEAFYNCRSLTNLTISEGVTSIGESAFSDCVGITSLTLPESIQSIEESAFSYCESLTSITIPDGVTSIGNAVFAGCASLESITVGKNNTVYHSAENCLIETESNTLIAGCKNSVIPIDGSVTSIGNSAFLSCSSLTSITIPEGVTGIGDWVFGYCSSLTSIEISNSVTSIGEFAFYNCRMLETIYYTGSEEEWAAISIGDNNEKLENAEIIYNYNPEEQS